MCHQTTGKNYDRPICLKDKEVLKNYYSSIDSEVIDNIYACITDKNYPQPAVLVLIVEMLYRDQKNDTGLYPVPLLPFSAMDLETGQRIQTPEMYAFHAVFESFALAQRNFQLMNQYLEKTFGKRIELFCDCGCSYRPVENNPELDNIINSINAFRSFYESIGSPIVRPTSFYDSQRTQRTLDMGPSEIQSYQRMYAILTALDRQSIQEPEEVYQTRNRLKTTCQKYCVI